ncbi:MAG: hypothetical protein NT150_12650 [Bacteroidetes bacterium]|nr:hypothetical protein [Bacteroidota bacterium]
MKAAFTPWSLVRKSLVRENSSDGISSPVEKSLFKEFLSGIQTGGYYRGFFYNRDMNQAYGDGPKRSMSVGDGYFDPTMFLYVGGQPTATTSFGTEVMIGNPFQVYKGPGIGAAPTVSPFFSAVLRGNINTPIGNFFLIAGGIEWTKLTPFTFGANVGFNRFSIFERRPWDPAGNVKTRYASYYYSGAITQDNRFGTQAFKGFMATGLITKINTNVDIFYGKTGANGGINRENEVKPSQNLGIRLKKNLKDNNYVSLNTFNNFNRSDSIKSKNDVQWNIITSEFSFKIKGISLKGEVGAGRYVSPSYKENWSEGVILDLSIPKKYTFIPLDFRYYTIGKSFTSNVANFNNTTIKEVYTGYQGNTGTTSLQPFGPSLDNVGDIANNRMGGAVNTNFKVWKFMVSTGTQISAEKELIANGKVLNYGHRVNSLLWSRLPGYFPIPGMFGPNNRVGTYYRGAYEQVNLTDTLANGNAQFKRFYNAFDFQVKYKMNVLDRDLYVNYLGTFSSVQKQFSAFTKFDNSAYIRAQYHEMDVYYQLHKNFILTLYGGIEMIKGNQSTDLGTNGNARDQVGKAIGVGFDFSLTSSTTLYIRQRWFSFEDKNFATEKFSGNEGTLELKVMF